MASASVDVAVVGAANVDLVVHVPRLPTAGQTVFAAPLRTLPGGKGLNQAIAVAHLSGTAALVARIGDDAWGQLVHDALVAARVDTTGAVRVCGSVTAAAIVQVPPDGDSAVILARTADCLPTVSDVDAAAVILARATVTVVHLELPAPVVDRSIALATGEVIGTLAPQGPLPTTTMRRLDALVVNAAEAAAILGATDREVTDSPLEAARALIQTGPSMAVVTLGAAGAAYASGDTEGAVPAPVVPVTDTAGAGDAALAAFALARAGGHPLRQAVTAAVEAGSAAVQRPGAALIDQPPAR
jgi:ribokinase